MLNKKYCVIGTGYVGLPCAIMLANAGCKVLGYDIDPQTVDSVNNQTIQLEPELKDILLSDTVRMNLRASVVIEPSDVFIVAVPTPIHPQKKIAELSALMKAIDAILTVAKNGDLVIVESTIPPLTIDKLLVPAFAEKGFQVGHDIFMAHCPERLLPGNIVHEIIHNNRIIGGVNSISADLAADVYRIFIKGKISVTNAVTAELCKLMENTYRDVNIALANELSEVCRDIGVDIFEAIDLANMHPRVNFLKPGIGVGGHCLPIDPWFIHEVSPRNSSMIMTARHINDNRPTQIAAKIRRIIAPFSQKKILLLGKTYKADTNDIRESPSIEIYNLLHGDGYNVCSFDSQIDDLQSLRALVEDCSFVFILVPHKMMLEEFYKIIDSMKENGNSVPQVFLIDH